MKVIRPRAIYGHLATLKLCQRAGYDPRLRNAARRILMILAGFADVNGVCWPSVSRIAEKLSMTRAAVRKQMNVLQQLGYLKREVQHEKWSGRQLSNLITLNITESSEKTIDDEVVEEKVTPSATSSGTRGNTYYISSCGTLYSIPNKTSN